MPLLGMLRDRIDNTLTPIWFWIFAGIGFEAFRRTMGWMDALYRETLFPASVFEGQTTFSGDRVKQFYQFLIENDTLQLYIQVQKFDFILMLTMFFALAALTIAAYRSLPNYRWLKNIAWVIAIIAPLAPFFDAAENLVSFFMLANPSQFTNWLATLHSSFASIKFGLSGLGFIWSFTMGLLSLVVGTYRFMCVRRA